jgi:hypothetical protein
VCSLWQEVCRQIGWMFTPDRWPGGEDAQL